MKRIKKMLNIHTNEKDINNENLIQDGTKEKINSREVYI
jgi:hypothetical protein